MKEVRVLTWCDWPTCAESSRKKSPEGQETTNIQVWLYTPGRGRKPLPVQIEVCPAHLAEAKDLWQTIASLPGAQKVEVEDGE